MNLAEEKITAPVLMDWHLITRAEAFTELARRIALNEWMFNMLQATNNNMPGECQTAAATRTF